MNRNRTQNFTHFVSQLDPEILIKNKNLLFICSGITYRFINKLQTEFISIFSVFETIYAISGSCFMPISPENTFRRKELEHWPGMGQSKHRDLETAQFVCRDKNVLATIFVIKSSKTFESQTADRQSR